jgi:selT/selW/selH-like putative selenoprotein
LRDELSNKFGEIVKLKPGDRGAFEVFLNNSLIFSKLKEDRFPDNQEIVLFMEGVLNVT